MKTRLQRWGDDLVVRIPSDFADKMALREGSDLEMDMDDASLTLRPVDPSRLTLEDLLAQITPENVHEEISWGKPRGKAESLTF